MFIARWRETGGREHANCQLFVIELYADFPDQIARRFMCARATSVQSLLESLAALGQAEMVEERRCTA